MLPLNNGSQSSAYDLKENLRVGLIVWKVSGVLPHHCTSWANIFHICDCTPCVMGKGQPADPGSADCFTSDNLLQILFLPKINQELMGCLFIHSAWPTWGEPCICEKWRVWTELILLCSKYDEAENAGLVADVHRMTCCALQQGPGRRTILDTHRN